ncbi:MAG: adenylate/guanylate cyclase domain-containing protein [Ilumatobacter sp.]|uniref:adenylate/guanylate cyclase domain-containing protein n=1 Tax=Ilumatobacter sp. TaxID=1967498 RepID=UPI002607FEE8|nr:adenylate/guanylate cyclase domain-containing protein [Ilumatobacter sp.]MDJ0770923.1 adenylate/guanylate cyclase domain-containing protein [Ilumatobacter sp.]
MSDQYGVARAANRVERSFAFVDLSGFTAFTDSEGDDRAVEILAAFRTLVRDVASAHAVRVAKWLGDGAMLVGVESEPLIEAIVDLEHRIDDIGSPLPLRAGIAAGRVILFEGDDYIGRPVNLASRLCDLADPHEVLAERIAVSPLLVNTAVEPVGRHEIAGMLEPVDVVRLTSSAAAAARAETSAAPPEIR